MKRTTLGAQVLRLHIRRGMEQEVDLPVGGLAAAAHHHQDRLALSRIPYVRSTRRRRRRKVQLRANSPSQGARQSGAAAQQRVRQRLPLRLQHRVQIDVRQRVHNQNDASSGSAGIQLAQRSVHARRQLSAAHFLQRERRNRITTLLLQEGGEMDS